MSGDDDVLRVPLVHLRHAAAQDLLTAAREGVGAGDGAAVNAPHVNVGACTRYNIPLRHSKQTHSASAERYQSLLIVSGSAETLPRTHRQLIDAQSGDGRPVAPELRDEGELVEVPDDARSIPRAADNDAVRGRGGQTRHGIRVTQ